MRTVGRIGVALGFGIVCFLIVLIFVQFVSAVIGGFFGAFVSYILLSAINRDKDSEKVEKEKPEPSISVDEKMDNIEQELLQLNILARTEGLPMEVLQLIESAVDMLRRLLPQMMERYSDQELTWETERISEVHLPNLVLRYVAYDRSVRIEKQSVMEEAVGALLQTLSDVEEVLTTAKEADFGRVATVIKMKYSK